jgi:hypothetical protein
MKPLRVLLAAAAFAVVAPALAQTQQPPPSPAEVRQAVMQACGAQISQFCGKVEPGGGRLLQCLKAHFQELTPQCKARLAEAYALKQEEKP